MGKGWRYYEEKVSDLRQEMAKLIASRWLCSEEELRTIVEEVQKEVLAVLSIFPIRTSLDNSDPLEPRGIGCSSPVFLGFCQGRMNLTSLITPMAFVLAGDRPHFIDK
jgi:hypothetical protein